MKKKATNEPIVLSGRVYFEGFLAEVAGSALPSAEKLLRGDLRLHNVNKPGSRARFGETVEFSGFFSGSVFDGKKWRRLLMRQHAAVDASYVGTIARRDKAQACKRHLATLAGKTAVWVEKDSGYAVTYADNRAGTTVKTAAASGSVATEPDKGPGTTDTGKKAANASAAMPDKEAADKTAADETAIDGLATTQPSTADAQVDGAGAETVVTRTVKTVTTRTVKTVTTTCKNVTAKPRRRRRKENPNQMKLF